MRSFAYLSSQNSYKMLKSGWTLIQSSLIFIWHQLRLVRLVKQLLNNRGPNQNERVVPLFKDQRDFLSVFLVLELFTIQPA